MGDIGRLAMALLATSYVAACSQNPPVRMPAPNLEAVKEYIEQAKGPDGQGIYATINPATLMEPQAKEEFPLARKVAQDLASGITLGGNGISRYKHMTSMDYLDKVTGDVVNETVTQRMRILYSIDPKKVEDLNPEDIFDDITPYMFRYGLFEIEDRGFAASVEAKVFMDPKTKEFLWNNPRNRLILSWRDSLQNSSFTDIGIDGIVEDSSGVLTKDVDAAFAYFLGRVSQLYKTK